MVVDNSRKRGERERERENKSDSANVLISRQLKMLSQKAALKAFVLSAAAPTVCVFKCVCVELLLATFMAVSISVLQQSEKF